LLGMGMWNLIEKNITSLPSVRALQNKLELYRWE
jgi:hypothetical protein